MDTGLNGKFMCCFVCCCRPTARHWSEWEIDVLFCLLLQTYSKTVSMLPYKHIDHIKEAARSLNVLYTYDRSYEAYMVFWLFPLQIAFRDKDKLAQDHGQCL